MDAMLAVARIALTFGQVHRVTMHEDGAFESDATHTVMLALLVMDVAPRVSGCNVGLAVQFAVVHDLAETYAGDTNTARGLTIEEAEAKATREAKAMRRLAGELGGDSAALSLLHRYEEQCEPEARLVRYLDKVLPKLTHFLNGGAALQAIGLTVDDVREKHAQQGAALADQYPEMVEVRAMFNGACALIERGIADGRVRVAE